MEHGSFLRRLGGVLAVAVVATAAGACLHAQPAHADPLLDAKRARYTQVHTEIRHLDNHAEILTEQYDKVVWQLGVLRRRMRITTHRLIVERAKLRHEQAVLARLLVEQYKGGDPRTIEIVLSASSLAQVTGGMDLKQRLDTAVADTVMAINAAKLAIAAERRSIAAAQVRERADKRQIILRRREIRRELRKRRRLVGTLGRQITVMTAADRIGQADLALQAQKWLTADLHADVADPGQELRDQVALEALQQIGVPYVWGGATPKGFDCSGLVMWLWAKHGIALPHFAASQYHLGPSITKAQLRPGDLVFFHHLGHVAIYIGNGWVVHAPHTGDWVRMERFSLGWFQATYVGATQPGPA
jgi:cell wall-associated NlpC family hydrolase